MVTALGLRLPFFTQSLWLDESIEALALMGRQGPLLSYALADYQPPLYHFIGYAVTHILGFSEIALRLPSLIAGLVTVYFVMKIGTLVSGRKVSAIAGLLAATNPLLIYYAQEGRTYAMTACFVTISAYYFLQLLNSKSTRSYLLYTIFTALFLWTSYLSWFLLLAQIIYVLRVKRYDLFKCQLVSATTWLLWFPSFLDSLSVGRYTLALSDAWGKVVGGLSWKSLPLTWVKFVIGRITFTNKMFYGGVVAAVALLHWRILRKSNIQNNLILLIWLIVPVILGILTAAFLPVYSYFRVLFVLPAYLLLLALGLGKLPKIYTTMLLALNLCFLSIFWFTPSLHREDWRSLSRDLHGDPTSQIAMPSHEQNPGLLYYGIDEKRIFEPASEPIVTDRVYYIRYAEDLFDANQLGPAHLRDSGYTIASQKVYTGIALDIYEHSD